ncbi:MoaF C-terminal domain-containing protein [Salinibacterium sp. G-O1]|uniref:MoaF C-terminal domain-containing protein n=1 Tax=Salinibacterium sp. G-O1 TaxID=3046208 RepID=UPI0024B9168D|nr:MoaF C-terminal domain-containing protein [Salinibacterium sp. G-O1]MDJ0336404.1 MoaF C-terminal domain-containing protein [Salinibacterium sp. G-O1]
MTAATRDYVDHDDFHDVETGPAFLEWTAGMEANRPDHTDALDGVVELHREDGAVLELTIDAGEARWQVTKAPAIVEKDDWFGLSSGSAPVEVLPLNGDIFFIDMVIGGGSPEGATGATVVIDRANDRALVIYSWTYDRGDARRTKSRITPVGIDGPAADPIARTTDLVGRRALWVYSDDHAYEHVYFNAGTYAWHCLAGPEKSIADVDRTETYKLNSTAYVFFVTETAQPWDGVFVLDFTPGASTNIGRFFGWDPKPNVPSHNSFGAVGRILNQTDYTM